MNLQKLFKTQQALEQHINAQHPLQEGEDRLSKKILALQVELGECANEWRGFKYWGNFYVPEGKSEFECDCCEGAGFFDKFTPVDGHWTDDCQQCKGSGLNPLLEEYVDVLHFALGIGLEIGVTIESVYLLEKSSKAITERFTSLLVGYGILATQPNNIESSYRELFAGTIRLGIKLGFSLEEIDEAYYIKNTINHQRQDLGVY